MERLLTGCLICLELLCLVACGGGSDDGPVKGTDRSAAGTPVTTSFYLQVALPPESSTSALTDGASSIPLQPLAQAARNGVNAVPLEGQLITHLTKDHFDAVVLVPDVNMSEGVREVPVEIVSFEPFRDDGVYRVDIDGLPQVNGIIYVTVGGRRLVFLMLKVGTRTEPAQVNLLTSAVDAALVDELKKLPDPAAASMEVVLAARDEAAACLEEQEPGGTENLDAYYRTLLQQTCALPSLGEVESCPDGEAGLCAIGGVVEGLNGIVRLALNGESELYVANNGPFIFSSRLRGGVGYEVTILAQPDGQLCALENASGVVEGTVDTIRVNCRTIPQPYTIGGTVSGLAGQVTLSLNDSETLSITANGTYSFLTSLAQGAAYEVELLSSAIGQTCSLTGATGEVAEQNVENVNLTCTQLATYRVRGTISGLEEGVSLTLNGSETITVRDGNTFAFATPLFPQQSYSVRVTDVLANERCVVQNATGTIANGDAQLSVRCRFASESISAGPNHTCTTLDGDMRCWGANNENQLGSGRGADQAFPIRVTQVDGAWKVVSGRAHNCALLVGGGAVQCWGDNSYGQLGTNSSGSEVPLNGPVLDLAAGENTSCAVLASGEVQCWGESVGDGGGELELPSVVRGLDAIAVAVEYRRVCTVMASGSVRCWGENGTGQLGNGTTQNSSEPVAVTGIDQAVSIDADDTNTCALLQDGSVMCWGSDYGATPRQITGVTNAIAIGVGDDHGCSVLLNGTVQCWGQNDEGQLGNGNIGGISDAVTVTGIDDAVAIAVGEFHSCVVRNEGDVACWGSNYNNQLGRESGANSADPSAVGGLTGVAEVSSGWNHSCARTAEGSVYCWGNNDFSQLGIESTEPTAGPVLAHFYLNIDVQVRQISSGDRHSCALTQSGGVLCWGDTGEGQAGYEHEVGLVYYPSWVMGLGTSKSISAGSRFSCASNDIGSAVCWGSNSAGQLGRSTAELPNSFTPQAIPQVTGALSVSAGYAHACALIKGGLVQCWGDNSRGQLGDGRDTFVNSATPVTVVGITNAIEVDVGGNVSCALLESGTLQCWGDNQYGQLGGSTGASRIATPQTVQLPFTPLSFSVSADTACAWPEDGPMNCWGLIAMSWTTRISSATYWLKPQLLFDSAATSFSAGNSSYFMCWVTTNATVECFGRNEYGQLGVEPDLVRSAVPLSVPFYTE